MFERPAANKPAVRRGALLLALVAAVAVQGGATATARDELGPLEAVLRDLWRQDLKRLEKVIERDQAEGISE